MLVLASAKLKISGKSRETVFLTCALYISCAQCQCIASDLQLKQESCCRDGVSQHRGWGF